MRKMLVGTDLSPSIDWEGFVWCWLGGRLPYRRSGTYIM